MQRIHADQSIGLGSVLDIQIRFTSGHDIQGVSVGAASESANDSTMLMWIIAADRTKTPETFDLVIESYNANSVAQSALKTDTVQVTILEAIAPKFVDQLPKFEFFAGYPAKITLPSINDGTFTTSLSADYGTDLGSCLTLTRDSG